MTDDARNTALNEYGQPVGFAIDDWSGCERPSRDAMTGRFCRVEPVTDDRHVTDLFEANALDTDGRNWTYLPAPPFRVEAEYRDWFNATCLGDDPLFHAIIDLATDKAVGVASLMRIVPAMGVIETGNINYSPRLQRHPAATEAMFLLMRRVFDELGYRRYEWKCDDQNAPSRAAALRLGFTFEGIFRQALVYKQRNRDTAWFSIIDSEWPALKRGYEAWLDPSNFDADGQQRRSLGDLIAVERG